MIDQKKEILNRSDISVDKEYSLAYRHVAPRHKINLKEPVIITAIGKSIPDQEDYHVLQGRTLDISVSGLALIISSDTRQELKKLGDEWVMHLLLPLPAKSIELEVTPVRYQELSNSETGDVLVGTHITDMKGQDRIIFMEFINQFESGPNEKKAASGNQTGFDINKVIGMDLYTAFVWLRQHGHTLRVVRKDGNDCIVPRNYYPNRIDVATHKDIIVSILELR